MNCYIFIPGRSWELSLAEVKSILPTNSSKIIKATSYYFYIEGEKEIDTKRYIDLLGGTVKIGKVIALLDKKKDLRKELVNQLVSLGDLKVTFGVTNLNDSRIDIDFLSNIKTSLEEKGITSRFIVSKSPTGLSSVVIKKQHATEFLILDLNDNNVIAQILNVQDFEDWGKRDFKRPCFDPKIGMLPPKVARIMINLAYSIYQRSTNENQKPMLLDPFCGVGTIPAEAMILGWDVIASDFSKEMIDKTQKNLTWLKTQYAIKGEDKCFISDATHISDRLLKESIDAIVTEPFMGQNFEIMPSIGLVKRTISGLERLYRGSLKDWYKVLKRGGFIIITIPSFNIRGGALLCKKTIDNCENLGYTRLSGPFLYARPQAIVARNIYVLKRN